MSILAPARSARKAYWQTGLTIMLGMLLIFTTFLIEGYMPQQWLNTYWFPHLFPVLMYIPFLAFYLAPTSILGLVVLIVGAVRFLTLSKKW